MKDYKIPKGQVSWVRYLENGSVIYIITSNNIRDKYFLYEVNSEGKLIKKAVSIQPVFKELKDWEA